MCVCYVEAYVTSFNLYSLVSLRSRIKCGTYSNTNLSYHILIMVGAGYTVNGDVNPHTDVDELHFKQRRYSKRRMEEVMNVGYFKRIESKQKKMLNVLCVCWV